MERMEIEGIALDLDISGKGPPLLYLPAESYGHLHIPFLDGLSGSWTVYAPRHPGFDGRTPPDDFRRVEDLAYLYLDLLDALNLDRVVLLGASFGGWIAMEMAIRERSRLSALGLIAPVGVKLSSREERDFTDIFAAPEPENLKILFADKVPEYAAFSDDEMTQAGLGKQYLAYYGWKPYLHNPSLARWLHRINVPTQLVWGRSDGFVGLDYGKRLASRIPNAKLDVLPNTGHYPQIEKTAETVSLLTNGPCAAP
ncbi:MAG: 2-hydroxy-6-oxo-6-phenylhexa-2,4-dienoate hydrolase [Alphaproteobacteria bacterium MarineAlpha4_Bin2]|nr:MAG: 2-hydroxy-6-oxo-6-phenylhexa-2,4-dienoate hydrolase [Alphaproteobacteria bacterium MarineAlpha4_Bin2]